MSLTITNLDLNNDDELLQMLKEKFTDEEEEMFINSFYMFLKYDKLNDFVIDLENVYKWVGFSTKGNAMKLVKRISTINKDYKIVLIQSERPKNEGGSNKEQVLLNINTFKRLCLKANTTKADQIHDYYIKMEEVLQQYINNQQQKQHEKIKNDTKSQTLIEQYTNKSINYLGVVEEDKAYESSIIKYGCTDFVKDTLSRHRKTYGYDFYYIHMLECQNKELLERSIRNHPELKARHVKEYNGKKCQELIKVDKNFPVEKVIDIIKALYEVHIKNQETRQIEIEAELKKKELEIRQREVEDELDKKREETKQKELETNQMKEQTRQKELEKEIEIKRMDFQLEMKRLEIRQLELQQNRQSINKEQEVQPITEQMEEETLYPSEDYDETNGLFREWLDERLIYDDKYVLSFAEVSESFFGHKLKSNNLAALYINDLEEFVKVKFAGKGIKRGQYSYKNKRLTGWNNLIIKTF